MAFVPNPSPTDDNQSSGRDLSIINTDDEMHVDTTNWTPAKWKKATTYDQISQRIPVGIW